MSSAKTIISNSTDDNQVFLYGCGTLLDACYEEICGLIGRSPDGVIDASTNKIGREMKGFICHGPEKLAEFQRPFVIITTRKHWDLVSIVKKINPSAEILLVNFQMAFHKAIELIPVTRGLPLTLPNIENNFCGKRALVTGATKGIGKAIAQRLAQMGFDLILISRSQTDLANLKNELGYQNVSVETIAADLARSDDLNHVLNHPTIANLAVDLVYNNAAISFSNRDFREKSISPEDMLYAYALNVVAPIAIAEHFLRLATASRPVRIVNISSNADNPYNTSYTLTKAALNKYTFDCYKNYATHHGLCYLLDPSDIRTPMNPTGSNEVGAVFPGVLLPIFCKSTQKLSMLHANEFSGMRLEDAVAGLLAKYPEQWQLEVIK
jgi:short-subunit dehydrogenase